MEEKEIKILIEEGFTFDCGNRIFEVPPMTLDTMFRSDKFAIQLKGEIEENSNKSVFEMVVHNVPIMIDLINVCVKKNLWDRIFGIKRQLKKMTPKDLSGICSYILEMHDLANFLTAIRLLGEVRITKPKKTETIAGNK